MSMTVFGDIARERERQAALKKAGKLKWTCADQKPTDGYKVGVLAKQVGDVATVVVEQGADGAPITLRKELVQVAAVAVAWIEAIDRAAEPATE